MDEPADGALPMLEFPAILGFPAVPFPFYITIPPCSHYGFEGKDDFLIPTEDETFPPFPNVDYDSEEDQTIHDMLLRTQTQPTRTKQKNAVRKFSPKPVLMKK